MFKELKRNAKTINQQVKSLSKDKKITKKEPNRNSGIEKYDCNKKFTIGAHDGKRKNEWMNLVTDQ